MKYFEVINDKNVLQIDDSYKNLVLKRKTTATISEHNNPISYDSAFYVDIPTENDEILIAARPVGTNDRGFILTITRAGAPARITVAESDYDDPSPVGQQFEVYFFSPNHPLKNNNHAGLQVFDANGKTVFDSAYNYFKPVYAQFGTMHIIARDVVGFDGDNYYSWLGRPYKHLKDIPNGRQYAVAQTLTPWYNWYYHPQTGGEIAVLGYRFLDNAVWLHSFPIYNSGGKDTTITAPTMWKEMDVRVNYLIVDVTNF